MKRHEIDVLRKLLASEGRMVPVDELLPGSSTNYQLLCKLQRACSALRVMLAEAEIEIRGNGRPWHNTSAYALFDTLALRGEAHAS